MKVSGALKLGGLVLIVLLAAAVYLLLWPVITQKAEHRIAEIGLTSNEVAANGPLPGDVSLYAKELACTEKLPTPGYYPSINGAEIADAQRSGLFPCATFTGNFDGPNRVFAWRSQDGYQAANFVNNRKPGELCITGGDNPSLTGPVAPGPFVAKVDATTGAQIWRTYLDNANVSGNFIATANLNILTNGKIVFAWSHNIVLLDPDTGLILKSNTLPTGDTPLADASFKHVTIAPDGTLIMKTQARPTGSTEQGSMAIIKGVQQGLKQANSVIAAVDSNTLEVHDWVQMSEPATTPHIITMFEGKIATYIAANDHAFRYFWDPKTKKLSQDESWIVPYLQKGQSTGDAPTLMGDWVTIQTNGIGSKTVASSIVAISQHDAKKMTTVFPFGPLKEGEQSFAPPKSGGDPENNLVYSADMGIGKVAGVRIDQATGEMKTAWVVDDITSGFQPLIGPKDKRVLLISRMKKNVEKEPLLPALMTGNYKEQVTWRDAATGRLMAESDFFEGLTVGSLITPGFGGRVYFPTGKGFITMQVMPAGASPSSK
jgi:hypothetical protein